MADSTARNYYQFMNEAIPEVKELPRRRTQTPTRRKIVTSPKSVPFNRLEKVMLTIGASVAIVMMFVLVAFSISQTSAQRQLQNSNTAVATIKSQNTDLEQEIGELTSTERINKIAKQQGLQLIDSNIRTIR